MPRISALAAAAMLISAPALAADYNPHMLVLFFADNTKLEVSATSRATCEEAMGAIEVGWIYQDLPRPAYMQCVPGNGFAAGSEFIHGFNDPGTKAQRR